MTVHPSHTTLLNQLKALHAHPECLRKPHFAEVAVWLRRVAAQHGLDEASAPKTRPGRKSMIPVPPTRRVISFRASQIMKSKVHDAAVEA